MWTITSAYTDAQRSVWLDPNSLILSFQCDIFMLSSSCLGFGPQWKPAAINSTQEFQDLFEGHKQLKDTHTFFVYGSTIRPNGTVISHDDYRLDRSGETKKSLKHWWFF